MLALATNSTILARLEAVPAAAWMRIGIGVLALFLLVIVLRKVTKMNKVVLGIVVFLVGTFVGFNWIYERNEPKWASPVVSKLAGFFPTKDAMK